MLSTLSGSELKLKVRLTNMFGTLRGGSPTDLEKRMVDDTAKRAMVVKSSGAKAP